MFLHNIKQKLLVTVAVSASALGLVACEVGAYPLDIFPEMHYQQSYKTQEPPAVPTPSGSIPIQGREVVQTPEQLATAENPMVTNEDQASVTVAGSKLFATNCAMCHGNLADGESEVAFRFTDAGVRAPPSLTSGPAAAYSDGILFSILTHGQSNMPAFQRLLTTDERWMLVSYLRSIQK